jgi:hypothetical protein
MYISGIYFCQGLRKYGGGVADRVDEGHGAGPIEGPEIVTPPRNFAFPEVSCFVDLAVLVAVYASGVDH